MSILLTTTLTTLKQVALEKTKVILLETLEDTFNKAVNSHEFNTYKNKALFFKDVAIDFIKGFPKELRQEILEHIFDRMSDNDKEWNKTIDEPMVRRIDSIKRRTKPNTSVA